jgi:hypothetical protein
LADAKIPGHFQELSTVLYVLGAPNLNRLNLRLRISYSAGGLNDQSLIGALNGDVPKGDGTQSATNTGRRQCGFYADDLLLGRSSR